MSYRYDPEYMPATPTDIPYSQNTLDHHVYYPSHPYSPYKDKSLPRSPDLLREPGQDKTEKEKLYELIEYCFNNSEVGKFRWKKIGDFFYLYIENLKHGIKLTAKEKQIL